MNDRHPRVVTRADVARLAGVSTAVVSYVVNDGPRPVAADTAARVREAIEMLGYRPNASARARKLGTTGVLGLVVPDSSNPFYAELALEVAGPYIAPYRQETHDGWNEPPVGPEWASPLAPAYFNYRKVSIYGGSNEIQKNIIAKAILGL